MVLDRFNIFALLFTTTTATLAFTTNGIYMYPSFALTFIGVSIFSIRNYQQSQPTSTQSIDNTPHALGPTTGESLKNMFLAELTTRNSGLGLNEFPNAISDEYFNETMMYIQLAFQTMGEQNFYAVYKDNNTDDMIQKVINLFPLNNDNPLAAIARKLSLSEYVINEINDNYLAVEDELYIRGGKIKRHEHAFHAQHHFLSDEQKTKLLTLANLKQKEITNKYPKNITKQANELFKWISNLCQSFNLFMTDIDLKINTAETALISKKVVSKPTEKSTIKTQAHLDNSKEIKIKEKEQPNKVPKATQPKTEKTQRLSIEEIRQRRLEAIEKREKAKIKNT